MEVRCGQKKLNEREKKYVHFLNSTLCATTRTICAILENYQTAEGVKVPDVLVPFMGGLAFLPFTKEKPVVKEIKGHDKAPAAAAGARRRARRRPRPRPSRRPRSPRGCRAGPGRCCPSRPPPRA